MKKKSVMQKSNFMQGAFIATLGIVITKILGILYVIPFYAIIGEQGGALYGYAYTFYLTFMAISTAGIPLAISKIVSEYHTLGYNNAKERAFLLGKRIAFILGIISFLVLFIFAPQIAHAVLGDLKGGNTIEDVSFVIRVISTAILVVPILSIYRGYFEGHKFITPTAISQVLEQVVRVLIIVVGSFIALRIFNLSLTTAVGVAVFGATAGSIFSYFYLVNKRFNNKNKFKEQEKNNDKVKISDKEIIKKIAIYAFPLIMIDIFKSLYSFVDTVTVVRTLGPLYGIKSAEAIMSVMSTWGAKFNMIIVSVSTGMIVSLTPNLTSSFVLNKMDDVREKINQSFKILTILIIPMTLGLSFLAEPVYTLFYGSSTFGPSVFAIYIFIALFMSFYTTSVTIAQVLKDYKTVFISLFTGVLLKTVLNIPLMNLFNSIGMEAYYGAIVSTIIGYFVSFIICTYALHKKFDVSYKSTLKEFLYVAVGSVLMIVSLLLLKIFVPYLASNRIMNLLIIIIYTLVGALVYFVFTNNTGTIDRIFGEELKNKILRKIIRK